MAATIKIFNSVNEFVKYCEEGKVNTTTFSKKLNSLASQDNNYNFRGTHSFKEALNLMLNGWDSGAKDLTKGLKLANSQVAPKEVTKLINDIVGFQVNVPNYLQGIPQSMINKKMVKQKQKVISLVKSISYAAYVSRDEILKDSIKFVQTIQAIEKQGIRVNAYTIWNAVQGSERLIIRCKIKSASERLNLSKMSFPLMHPSFLRRIMFRCLEIEQSFKNAGWQDGYGMPDQNCTPYLNKGEYYIPVLIKEHQLNDILSSIK